MNISTRALLVSTALTLPLAGGAMAQQIEINPDQLSSKSNECQNLGQVIADNDGNVETLSAQEVVTAINDDNAEQCATYAEEITTAAAGSTGELTTEQQAQAQATDEAQASDEATAEAEATAQAEADAEADVQVSEEVQATEQLDVEAEAQASVPAPNVDVQVPGSDVSVTPGTPSVTVDQSAPEIELEQPQPSVSVQIPEIVVRVDIPAPNLYVLQSDPTVSVSQGEPQVDVQQGEAQVEVSQPDPNVTIALAEDQVGENATPVEGDSGDVNASANQSVDGNVTTTRGQPTVQLVQNDEEPQVQINEGGAPSVTYMGSEPDVQVEFAQQPSVEIIQSGQPQVTFETAEERQQRQSQQGEQSGSAANVQDQEQQSEVQQTEDQAQNATAQGGQMTVADITGMEVMTANGESLGNPDAVIEMDGQQMLVVSSGGFLGLGDTQVPVELSSVTMQNGQIVLQELTEEQIENANNFEYNEEMALPEDAQVQVSN